MSDKEIPESESESRSESESGTDQTDDIAAVAPTKPERQDKTLPLGGDDLVEVVEAPPASAVDETMLELEAEPADDAARSATGDERAGDVVELVEMEDLEDLEQEGGIVELEAEPDDAFALPPPPPEEPEANEVLEAWPDERLFYKREAEALAEQQPERAALIWIEAAAAAERAGVDPEGILADVDRALALRADSPWLLPLTRRMMMRMRRYDRALDLSGREVALGGDNATRAAVLQEAAALLRHHRRDPEAALKRLELALTLQPGDVAALVAAAALRTDLGRHADATEALEQLGVSLTAPEERALYLYAAGTLHETRLDQPDAAESDYRRALEADRQHLPAAICLCGLYERRDMWPQLCGSLEHLAHLAPNHATEARLLHQAGSLHLDRTGDLETATRDLERASEAAPRDPSPLQRLAYVYEAKGEIRQLVHTLRRLLELTLDARGRAALLTHVGWLLHTRLGEAEEAIAAYREALEAVEGYLPAIQSLGTLYRNQGNFESLLQIYAPEVEGTLPAGARAMRCVEMGEILTRRLDRPEEACALYRRALELDPSLVLAFWGLSRLLRRLGHHEELARVLTTRVERCQDARTRNHLQLEIARLQAGPLEELEQAIGTLEGIDDNDHTRSVAAELLELYERGSHSAKRVAFLQAQADDTDDPEEARGRRLEAAAVLEFELEEHDQALAIYRLVLEDDPTCVAAIRGAGRIFHRLGWWNDLVKLHYHELVQSGTDRPDAATLLCRVGRILDEHLGQTSAAIKAYSKALERDPACAPALPALEPLVRAEKRWGDLVEVLKKYAEARMDRVAAADALCRAAEVADCQLGDLELAASLYEQARDLHPISGPARHGLLRVLRRQGNWSASVAILEELIEACKDEPEERCQLELELARTREYRLDEQPDLDLYRAAASSAPFDSRLRAEITRILTARGGPALVAWLQELGARTADPALAAAYLAESVYLGEFGEDGGDGLEAARQAYQRRPDDLAVIWSLERALWRGRCWDELGVLREKEAQFELDPAVRVAKLSGAAMAYLMATRAEEATRVARECLNFDAHCLPALRVLSRIAESEQDWKNLAGLCDRLAEACSSKDNRLESCLRAADLWSARVGDTGRALASLSVALTHQPDQPEAFARAEGLLREAGDFGELSRVYRRRIKASKEDATRVELFRAHARLLRDDLRDNNRAIAELTELLAQRPGDVEALTDLSDLLIAQGHWSDAASKLGLLIDKAEAPEIRQRARLRQAGLWLRQLHEPGKSRQVLGAALEEAPGDLEAKKLLVELCSTEGSWEEARGLLEQITASEAREDLVWATMKLAEVARLGLRDETLRDRYETEALRLVSDDDEALAALFGAFREQREQARIFKIASQLLDTGELAAADAARLRLQLARQLLLDEEHAPALKQLEACLLVDGKNTEARLLAAQAKEGMGDVADAAAGYRALLEEEIGCIGAYRGLARTMGQAGQHEIVASAATLIGLLGEAEPEETALLKGLAGAMSPAGAVDPAALGRPADGLQSIQEALALAAPYLESLYPTQMPEELPGGHPAATAARRLAQSLGLSGVRVAAGGSGGPDATAGLGDPVPLVVSSALEQTPGSAEFRFWVGRALCEAATSSTLLRRLSDDELEELLDALCTSRPVSRSAAALKKQIGKLLPRKLRKQLETIMPATSAPDLRRYRELEEQRADRAGLVMSRNPGAGIAELARTQGIGVEAIAATPRLAALMRYALSEAYARTARTLWV